MSSYTFEKKNTLDEWLQHCEHLHKIAIDMGLERAQKIKAEIGLNFDCPVITVAGTNGKGSTCAFLESICMAAGLKVGVYSSPHLVYFNERCRINQQMVSDAQLMGSFEAIEQARLNLGLSLSYFEFTTLVIMHCLSQQKLDVVILEVGLGGRLDAVNIIDTDCAIITNIDIDHVDFLGDDREKIGFEKAGVIRHGKPVIVNDLNPPASIAAHAQKIGAIVWQHGVDYSYEVAGINKAKDNPTWSWKGRAQHFEGLPFPSLAGSNQLLNATGVLAVLEALKEQLSISEEDIVRGLTQAVLLGRFQTIAETPTVILDVGHNPHAIKALLGNLAIDAGARKTYAVFGAMQDKDLEGILRLMIPQIQGWYFTDLPLPRAILAVELKKVWEMLREKMKTTTSTETIYGSCYKTPWEALQQARQDVKQADRIVVFGSFYTVGGVMEHILPLQEQK